MAVLDRTGEDITRSQTGRVYVTLSNAEVTLSALDLVEVHDGVWTVRDVLTGIFGSGADRDAAMADFEDAQREHLAVLEGQDALSPELSWQLAYLRNRLS